MSYEKYCEGVAGNGLSSGETLEDFFRNALEEIVASYGQVCEEFDICRHEACTGSVGAYLTALNVLEIAAALRQPVQVDHLF